MSFTNWFENVILNHIFGKGNYSPQTIYVGLCSSNPGEGATGGNCYEMPNQYAYSRVQTSSGIWTTSSGGIISNAAEVVFPHATGNWGTATHFVLTNSGSYGSGSVLLYGALAASRYVARNSVPRFDVGELSVTVNGGGASFSNWMENIVLNHIFSKAYYSPQTIWVGLCGNPYEGATSSNCGEVSNSNGYARVPTTSGIWNPSSGGLITNNAEIVFAPATDYWGWVRGFGLFSSGVYGGGNLLMFGDLPKDLAVYYLYALVFKPGDLRVYLA